MSQSEIDYALGKIVRPVVVSWKEDKAIAELCTLGYSDDGYRLILSDGSNFELPRRALMRVSGSGDSDYLWLELDERHLDYEHFFKDL